MWKLRHRGVVCPADWKPELRRRGGRRTAHLPVLCPRHVPQLSEPHPPVGALPASIPVNPRCTRTEWSPLGAAPGACQFLRVCVGLEPLPASPWACRLLGGMKGSRAWVEPGDTLCVRVCETGWQAGPGGSRCCCVWSFVFQAHRLLVWGHFFLHY